jgi:formyl-CoA transferase
MVLDLRQSTDRARLAELLAEADILVQNLKPGSLDKLGVGVEALRVRHPQLICCSISGYGEDGPLASRKAYDLLIQAESGLASITGGPDEPARVGISVVDIATGSTAHAAVLEALISRTKTGLGRDIRISMFDVMADWLTVPLLHHEGGSSPQRMGLAHPSIAPYGTFTTKDGSRLLIAIQNDREWMMFCERVVGDKSLATDERFATNFARVQRRPETDRLVGNAMGLLPLGEAIDALDQADIAFARINDMEGLSHHAHLRRMVVATSAGPTSYPAAAPIVVGEERAPPGAVPRLGENNLLQRPLARTDDKPRA